MVADAGSLATRSSVASPWGLSRALGSLGLALLFYVVPGSMFALLPFVRKHVLVAEFGSYVFFSIGVAVAALLLISKLESGAALLGYRFPGWSVLARAALGIVPIYLGIFLLAAAISLLFPDFQLKGNARQVLPINSHNTSPLAAGGIFLFVGVIVPLTEETLFRGIMFQGLASFFGKWMWREAAVFLGAMISGLVFGLLHFAPQTLPILVFVGVALAYVFHLTKSLYASMIVHSLFNSIAVIALLTS